MLTTATASSVSGFPTRAATRLVGATSPPSAGLHLQPGRAARKKREAKVRVLARGG